MPVEVLVPGVQDCREAHLSLKALIIPGKLQGTGSGGTGGTGTLDTVYGKSTSNGGARYTPKGLRWPNPSLPIFAPTNVWTALPSKVRSKSISSGYFTA